MTAIADRLAVDPLVARVDALFADVRSNILGQADDFSAELRELQLELTDAAAATSDQRWARELAPIYGHLALTLGRLIETWQREKVRALKHDTSRRMTPAELYAQQAGLRAS